MQGTRFEHRKKKRMNTVLNVAIGLVVVLIIVFAAQIFLGSSDTEDVALEIDEESEESVEIESESESETTPETEESTEAPEEAPDEDALEEDEDEEGTEEDDLEPAEDGEWEPVGTNQSGDFSHDFTRGGTNWNEMERALRYATGLGEDMITWRLENGGPTSVIGTVSAPDQQTTPYQVRLEWVDGQGWQPVSKEQLSNNPYRRG